MIKIVDSEQISIQEILAKREENQPDVTNQVKSILDEVRSRGDSALLEFTERYDGVKLKDLRVKEREIDAVFEQVEEKFLRVLRASADNIKKYHEKQICNGFAITDQPGVVIGQRVLPLQTVGVYVPGGTAPLPSTVLMDVIPAKIAGVKRIVMATPPAKDGSINPSILAAARVAGVTEIYKMGGAQAVAALSYGTESVPKVDKIVGPGNLFVATAKKMVYGVVDIDMIAGPSDILVVADDTANPRHIAADMLGQAEHDMLAAAVLVTTSKLVAQEVKEEINRLLPLLSRSEIATASILRNGIIIVVPNIQQGIEVSNAFAPEHLELCVEDPFALLSSVTNAGSIFLGHNTPEALGDYFAGTNHTLPTAGTARFYSPLSVDDFIKKSSYLYYSKEALEKVANQVEEFANHEFLEAHANSVTVRVTPEKAL